MVASLLSMGIFFPSTKMDFSTVLFLLQKDFFLIYSLTTLCSSPVHDVYHQLWSAQDRLLPPLRRLEQHSHAFSGLFEVSTLVPGNCY